jgi:hypothetical protein
MIIIIYLLLGFVGCLIILAIITARFLLAKEVLDELRESSPGLDETEKDKKLIGCGYNHLEILGIYKLKKYIPPQEKKETKHEEISRTSK